MAEQTPQSPEQTVQRWLKGEIRSQELFALDPQAMQALAEHGYLLYEQGKYRTAQVIFEGLTAVDAANPDYNRMLGAVYQMQGQWDASYYRYTLALKMVPNDIHSLTNRGEVLLRLGRKKEATDDFKQAIQMDFRNDHPAAKRARILMANFRLR